jgi:NAD(P)H-nitrite reductase large subunit
MTKAERIRYLIIGNSAGGVGAAEAIREVDKAGTIAVVSDEPYPAYSRPLISEYLVERCPLQRMLFRPPDFYEKNNIQAILGHKVAQLDIDKHAVKLDDGRTIVWEKLLLATGGLPIVPKIEGIGLKGVFTFTKLDDARAIDNFVNQQPRGEIRAVVIGGGLIGISVAEALNRRSVKVTIVEMQDRVLSTILDEEASCLVGEALKKAGVEILTGRTAGKIKGSRDGEVAGVELDNLRTIPCQMVVVAIGVQPRTDIAAEAGIKINRGIVVNRYMATSSPGIYACGDVAEAYNFIYGENRVTPIWPNACTGGRTAGFNMAGARTKYQGGTSMNAVKYFGLSIVSAGMVTPPDDSYEVLSEKRDHVYRKVILKDGLIEGMVFSGDIEKSGIIYSLMKDRIDVNGFKKSLVTEDFGLISLPEEIWRKMVESPPSAISSVVKPAKPPEKVVIRDLRFVFGGR